MNFGNRSHEMDFALQFARQAAELSDRVESEMRLSTLTKSDLSPVTTADFAIQALAGRLIQQHFPGDALVAEENSAMLLDGEAAASLDEITRVVSAIWPDTTPEKLCAWVDYGSGHDTSRRFWTLDPIDGTKGFIRGDQYATALALVIDGQVELGVLSCPKLLVEQGRASAVPTKGGSVLAGLKGGGAWVRPLKNGGDFSRLAVSGSADASRATLVRSYEDSHTDTDRLDRLIGILKIQAEPVRMDSQAKYALVAAGVADILLRFRSANRSYDAAKIWDHAAGALVVLEAGGCVTDIEGKELDFSAGRTLARNNGLLASNRLLHHVTLDGLKKISKPIR